MNAVREINRINQRELELGLAGKGSWHDEYKDSAYIFVGGLSFDLSEGDVITIFSQWGEIVDINMPRDKSTGKQRGFGFIMYEDQRSTVLAVDNMNGTQVLNRTIRVDHCRKYNQPGTKTKEGEHVAPEEPTYNAMPPVIEASDDSESDESEEEADNLDEEDPMAAFIRAEKKKEKVAAKALTDGKKKRKHEGEAKEERRARKEAKRAKRAEKELRKTIKKERYDTDDRRDRGSRRPGSEDRRERDGYSRDRSRTDERNGHRGHRRQSSTERRDDYTGASRSMGRGRIEDEGVRHRTNGGSRYERDYSEPRRERGEDYDRKRSEDARRPADDRRPRHDDRNAAVRDYRDDDRYARRGQEGEDRRPDRGDSYRRDDRYARDDRYSRDERDRR